MAPLFCREGCKLNPLKDVQLAQSFDIPEPKRLRLLEFIHKGGVDIAYSAFANLVNIAEQVGPPQLSSPLVEQLVDFINEDSVRVEDYDQVLRKIDEENVKMINLAKLEQMVIAKLEEVGKNLNDCGKDDKRNRNDDTTDDIGMEDGTNTVETNDDNKQDGKKAKGQMKDGKKDRRKKDPKCDVVNGVTWWTKK